ncbi:MAG: DUF4921 family protein, partial [Pirellulales bacterium]|nr:DUF4921 family protein [Pirellulales bacterium]
MIEAAKSRANSATAAAGPNVSAESRKDPLTGQWTIFAPHRDQRPDEFKQTRTLGRRVDCPFCRGHESSTPQPVWIGNIVDEEPLIDPEPLAGQSTEPDWLVRVVPNKYPAVSSSSSPNASATHEHHDLNFFESRPVAGGHEVIVESPDHVDSLTQLDVAQAALVFKAYRDRIRYWRAVPNIQYVSVFKNVGGDAGASLKHAHSQLVAIDRMPALVATLVHRQQRHHATTGCCLQCDLLRAELKSRRRIVAQTESLVAYCPFASRLPMLVRITTKEHQAHFEDLDDELLDQVSRLCVRVISWLERLYPGSSYNHLLHTCPPASTLDGDCYHWAMELFPRLTQVAGFEWSSQCMINPVLPEHAAARYRILAEAEDPR